MSPLCLRTSRAMNVLTCVIMSLWRICSEKQKRRRELYSCSIDADSTIAEGELVPSRYRHEQSIGSQAQERCKKSMILLVGPEIELISRTMNHSLWPLSSPPTAHLR